MKYFILLILISHYSFGEEGKGSTIDLKPWSAVSEFNERDGFKLTKKAQENLGVTFQGLKGKGPWVVPKSALLTIKHSQGVFRKWKGWITMVLVQAKEKSNKDVLIESIDLQEGDDVAITGGPFLRMTEADLNSDTVDACAH